jgi:DNA-binding response OmpR family regulator
VSSWDGRWNAEDERGAKMNKILIVDDDKGVQMLYADELGDEGYDVVTCGDGSRLMEFIEDERPDLVVMDRKLGKYDGVDLLQDIRKSFDQLPVIICTAYPGVRHNLKLVAPDDYVLKSSNLSELKLKIGKALEERKKPVSFENKSPREEGIPVPTWQTGFPWRETR